MRSVEDVGHLGIIAVHLWLLGHQRFTQILGQSLCYPASTEQGSTTCISPCSKLAWGITAIVHSLVPIIFFSALWDL